MEIVIWAWAKTLLSLPTLTELWDNSFFEALTLLALGTGGLAARGGGCRMTGLFVQILCCGMLQGLLYLTSLSA